MKTPYDILGVVSNAADTEIKQAYLRQIKAYPPERDPEQFRLIHEAYLAIKDKKSRISYELFNLPTIDFNELIDQMLDTDQSINITADQFEALLQANIDAAALQNVFSSGK